MPNEDPRVEDQIKRLVYGLVDQQAMADDWWQPELDAILSRLAGGTGSGEPQVSSGRLEQPAGDSGQSVNTSRTADAEEKPSTPSRAELLALAERLEDRSRMWAQFMRDEREAGDVALSNRSECWMMGLGFAAAELRKLLAASPSSPPPAAREVSRVEPSPNPNQKARSK